jgi:hypothetical protein
MNVTCSIAAIYHYHYRILWRKVDSMVVLLTVHIYKTTKATHELSCIQNKEAERTVLLAKEV